jgi:hypothetical protein
MNEIRSGKERKEKEKSAIQTRHSRKVQKDVNSTVFNSKPINFIFE